MSDFNVRGGIGIMGFLSPMNINDTYAVIDPIYGIDGLRNVNNINDLLTIPFERRRPGMLVGVDGGEIYYKLKNKNWDGTLSDWEEFLLNKEKYSDKESPLGLIDGVNQIFLLEHPPIENSEHIFLNGLLQEDGKDNDYIIIDKELVFNEPPLIGSRIRCSYRYFF